MKLAMKAIGLGAVFTGLIMIFSGCGYTTRSMISTKYKTIYVTPFANKIDITRDNDSGSRYKVYKPLLETDITQAVNDKYLFDGNLRPVRKERADVILRGEVVAFTRDPLSYNDNDDVEEYRLNIQVNIALWDANENTQIWAENGFTGTTTYFTSYYPVASQVKDQSVAINDAITDLARRIVERTVEEW